MNTEIFDNILGNIADDKIRLFTMAVLRDADPILEKIPASVSGKYHPPESLGEGGLVRHIQRTCYFANIFFNSWKLDNKDVKADIILSALLLHDLGKKEKYEKHWDYVDHPIVAAKMAAKHKDMLHPKIFALIEGCVKNHMGPFGSNHWKKPISNYNFLELAVYHCDYMASRKDLSIVRG